MSHKINFPKSCEALSDSEMEYDGGFSNKDWCVVGMVVAGLCVAGAGTMVVKSLGVEHSFLGSEGQKIIMSQETFNARVGCGLDTSMISSSVRIGNKDLFAGGLGLLAVGGTGLAGSAYHFTKER